MTISKPLKLHTLKTSKSKFKSILLSFTDLFAIIFLCLTTIGVFYTFNLLKNVKKPSFKPLDTKLVSKVYDSQNEVVETLDKESTDWVNYSDLPDIFINALVSTEDVRFFMHNGIDIPRLLDAIYTNITASSFKQGASTLTQQLVKNTMLNSNKTIKRKIEEAYLATKIEKLYSKKDIIEFYVNYICFDGINPGINVACLKYFNKKISSVTLPEAALLAGIINLPSFYNPFKNPIEATNRRNEVLDLMVKHHYISNYQATMAKNLPIDKMLYHKTSDDEKSYPFQAYLDVVYEQVKEYSGYDPYTTPMEIYTYLDTTLQSEIDLMQQNKSSYIHFDNDLQQMAASIINNDNGSIIAVFGGRNYTGKRLFNRAYDMVKQPASTIKPILSYALAYQYLNWSDKHCLVDDKTYYPNTTKEVHNVDYLHMGELLIDEAIGYSRNTIAVKTMQEVANKIGMNGIAKYLEDINLLDIKKENLSYSYALGAFSYGVSPTNLAASYAMLANQGIYQTPLAVKKIVLLENNQEIIFDNHRKQILDADSCYLLNNVLESVMKKNFWNINVIKPDDINVSAKTGTSSFDSNIIKEYNYPSNAYKDRWLAGYCKNISIAVWTGFDNTKKDEPTYFVPSSNDANIVKKFFRRIMDIAALKNQTYPRPDNIVTVSIVKGSNPYLLATNSINKDYIVEANFKRNAIPTNYICEPSIDKEPNYDYYVSTDKLTILLPQNNPINNVEYKKIFDYEKIYGKLTLICELINEKNETMEVELKDGINDIYMISNGNYTMKLYYKYKNGHNRGPIKTENIQINNNSFWF